MGQVQKHIIWTTRDEVHVSVANGLTGYSSIVHANIETAHGSILSHYLGANLVQQLVNRSSLRLEKIEESRSMSLGYNEGM